MRARQYRLARFFEAGFNEFVKPGENCQDVFASLVMVTGLVRPVGFRLFGRTLLHS